MSKTQQVNGVSMSGHTNSITIDHIVSYPLVSELVEYYKSMPLGARSIELSNNVYNAFGKPVISSPLVQNPYSYVYPYAKRVDELGDNTLSQIDANFPAIKETDFSNLKGHANSAIGYPFKVANESKDYLLNTYSNEYKKCGGPGLVPASKAVVTTELRILADALKTFGDWYGSKKDETEQQLSKAKDVGTEKFNQAKDVGTEKFNQAKDAGTDKFNQAKDAGSEQLNKAKDAGNEQASKAKDVGNEKVNHAKKQASHKKDELTQ